MCLDQRARGVGCAETSLNNRTETFVLSVKPACKAGLGLRSVNLDFKGVPVIPKMDKSGPLCLNFLYKQ